MSWSKNICTFIPRGTKKNIKLATFQVQNARKGKKKEQAVSNNILHQKCLSEDGDGLQF